jgi:hypothetical protein
MKNLCFALLLFLQSCDHSCPANPVNNVPQPPAGSQYKACRRCESGGQVRECFVVPVGATCFSNTGIEPRFFPNREAAEGYCLAYKNPSFGGCDR